MATCTPKSNSVYDQATIDTFSWMRFPLIVGVVLAHCNLPALLESWYGSAPTLPPWATWIFEQAYIYLFPARVPTLFLISGYFFFRGTQCYDKNFYARKYKRRIHSLLIPYILWNAIALLLIWTRHTIQFHSNIPESSDYTLMSYLSGFWNFTYNKGFTANAPLWFMRDLMVVTLCAPLLYPLLRKKYWILTLTLMAIVHIAGIEIPLSGCNVEAFLYFSIGATLAIHKTDITRIPQPIGIICLVLYFPTSQFLFGLSDQPWHTIMTLTTIFIKTIAAIYLISHLFKRKALAPTPILTQNSFFVFAFHGIVIGPVIKLMYILLGSNNPYILLCIYIAAPTITILLAFIVRHLLMRHLPSIGNWLSGNR